MKNLLDLAAVGEAGTGLILLVYPPVVIRLLFAAEITGAGVVVSRIAGISFDRIGNSLLAGSRGEVGTPRYTDLQLTCHSLPDLPGLRWKGAGKLLWPAVEMAGSASPASSNPAIEMVGFASPDPSSPVVEMPGFANRKYRPTVSRSIPSSRAIRRRDHPRSRSNSNPPIPSILMSDTYHDVCTHLIQEQTQIPACVVIIFHDDNREIA
jgi:hypothetical protein